MTLNLNLDELAQSGLIHQSWVEPLQPVQPVLLEIQSRLSRDVDQGRTFFPKPHNVMRAFTIPFDEVKVVILGQDPYPTSGDAVGLSFSVSPEQRQLPRSLRNIFTELQTDIGCAQPSNGDLTPWFEQGVMLLNRVLTVESGTAGSHRGIGWEEVTAQALSTLNNRKDKSLVAVLWGNDAISAKHYLDKSVLIESVHPSPLSASRGFFGSRPFSKVNKALEELGQTPIDWALPSYSALF
ncbi:uracil-DNA glycosylase [Aurantimicrobium minutum]|uniref:uracil-DNA glycosylase n=1 Tax=Aurantimicrobium minutum TaxID=708131 RepID=UPI0024738DA8|nr:uracil-DNA glycosylase [Aurantimicrobium minutum]MDH6238989.1 uracil-DNA glycosylase [Aurantimicrobium minutum]